MAPHPYEVDCSKHFSPLHLDFGLGLTALLDEMIRFPALLDEMMIYVSSFTRRDEASFFQKSYPSFVFPEKDPSFFLILIPKEKEKS